MKKFFIIYSLLLFLHNINTSLIAAEIDYSQIDTSNYEVIKPKLVSCPRMGSRPMLYPRFYQKFFMHPHIPLNEFMTKTSTTNVSSNNWAGYVASTDISNPSNAKNQVTKVIGNWSIPTITQSSQTTYCAAWVGIDGFNNPTVEQLGTESEFHTNAGFITYAWVEMYPQNAQIISNFPVKAGDKITASVTFSGVVKGSPTFNLAMINHTTGKKTDVIKSVASPVFRSCAEWVVEAPFLNGILPLSEFKPITFTSCRVTINGITGAIKNRNWDNAKIIMKNKTGQVKAQTSNIIASAPGKFTVAWKRST